MNNYEKGLSRAQAVEQLQKGIKMAHDSLASTWIELKGKLVVSSDGSQIESDVYFANVLTRSEFDKGWFAYIEPKNVNQVVFSKVEAVELMRKGEKISHLSDLEVFFTIENERIIASDGVSAGIDFFLNDSRPEFQTNYFIHHPLHKADSINAEVIQNSIAKSKELAEKTLSEILAQQTTNAFIKKEDRAMIELDTNYLKEIGKDSLTRNEALIVMGKGFEISHPVFKYGVTYTIKEGKVVSNNGVFESSLDEFIQQVQHPRFNENFFFYGDIVTNLVESNFKKVDDTTTIDCQSIEGLTIGLIDSLGYISTILADRSLAHNQIQEALKDLAANKSFKTLVEYLYPSKAKPEADDMLTQTLELPIVSIPPTRWNQ